MPFGGDLLKMLWNLSAISRAVITIFERWEKSPIGRLSALVLAICWIPVAAQGAEPPAMVASAATVASAEKVADHAAMAQYDLPPIVLQLPKRRDGAPRSMVVTAVLEFTADSDRAVTNDVSKAKMVMPMILDRILTGVVRVRDRAVAAGNADAVSRFLLKQVNDILRPYGVAAARLRMDDLHVR